MVIPGYVSVLDDEFAVVGLTSDFANGYYPLNEDGTRSSSTTVSFDRSLVWRLFIPKDVTEILNNTFSTFYNLRLVEFEEDSACTSIGTSAFSNAGSSLNGVVSTTEADLTINGTISDITNPQTMYASVPDGELSILVAMTEPDTDVDWNAIEPSIWRYRYNGTDVTGNFTVEFTTLDNDVLAAKVTIYDTSGFAIGDTLRITVQLQSSDKQACLGFTIIFIEDSDSDYSIQDYPAYLQVYIPSSVTSIGSSAFYYAKKVYFDGESNLRTIGSSAFYRAVDVEIPSSVTTIGSYAFYVASAVTFATSSNLESIDSRAFYNVETVTIPASVKTIGDYAFYSATDVTIESGSVLESIGAFAFYSASELELPATVSSIGGGAFKPGATVTIDEQNPYFKISDDCLLTTDGTLIYYFGDDDVLEFPDDVTAVADYVFSGNTTIKTVIIRDGISYGSFIFEGVALEEVVFEDDVTEIPQYLFALADLGSITIPSQIVTIGFKAFYNSGLTSVTFTDGSHITTIDSYAFVYNPDLTQVIFGSHDDGYSCTIEEGAFFACNSLSTVMMSDGFILTSIGTASFAKYDTGSSSTPQGTAIVIFSTNDQTDGYSITIPADVTYIGANAFGRISSSVPTTDPYADGAYVIPAGATAGSALNGISTIAFETGSNLSSIDSYAFSGYRGLKLIDLSSCSHLTDIGNSAFANTYPDDDDVALQILFPEDSSLLSIGASAFSGPINSVTGYSRTTLMSELTVPGSVTTIGTYAFGNVAYTLILGSENDPSQVTNVGDIMGTIRIVTTGEYTLDLSRCTSLEYVDVDSNFSNYSVVLPAGFYEVAYTSSNWYSKIANPENIILTVDGDSLGIGADTIAVNSAVVHGLESITVDPENQYFSVVDGCLIYNDDENVRLVAVTSGTTGVVIDDGSGITSVDSGVFAGSDLQTLVIDSAVSLGDGLFDGMGEGDGIEVYISCDPDGLELSTATFAGSPRELTFYVSQDVYDAFGIYLAVVGDVRVGLSDEDGTYTVYIQETVGGVSFTLDQSIEGGTYTATFDFDGGYTLYDIAVYADGSEVAVDDPFEISLELEPGGTVITFEVRERAGDVTVTFDSNGGAEDDVTIQLTSGLTLIDSDFPEFTRDSYTFLGWSTDQNSSEADYDASSRVTGDLTLYAVWQARDPMVFVDVKAGDVYINGTLVDESYTPESNETMMVFTINPYTGYVVTGWVYTMDGVTRTSEGETLTLEGITGDVTVSVEAVYSSPSSGLNPVSHEGLPTADELPGLSTVFVTSNDVDTSGMYWTGHASVPLIVDTTVYFRAGDRIYAMESDTGYIFASATSISTTAYYHQLGYGNGLIVDYLTSTVYHLDLTVAFTLANSVNGVEYYDGYFYTSGTTVYRFPADASAADGGVMSLELVGTMGKTVYSSYGFSKSVFADGYLYRVYSDGNERGIVAMDLNTGSSTYVALSALQSYYLDDGWISYYDGTLFLTGYTNGLFGAVATTGYDVIAWVDVDGLTFSNYNFFTFDGTHGNEEVTFASEFVVYDGYGYINAGTHFYVFEVSSGPNKEISLVGYIDSTASHGSIVIDVSYDGAVYAYLIPYGGSSSVSHMVFEFDLDTRELTSTTGVYSYGYNSQAVRADADGRMIWYNDTGHIFAATTAEKNVFFFFIQDGDSGMWYQAYGATPDEALASLGRDVATVGTMRDLASVYGESAASNGWRIYGLVESSIMVYDWVQIDSFTGGTYDTVHYYVITDTDLPGDGEAFTYDGGTYAFAENVGDRSVVGVQLTATVHSVVFLDEDGGVISTVTVSEDGTVAGGFPDVDDRAGYTYAWLDEDGEVVDELPESFESSAVYRLSWTKVIYDVSAAFEDGTLTVTVSNGSGESEITDPHLLVILDYGDSAKWTYLEIGFDEGTATATVTVDDTEGLSAISVTLVSSDDDMLVDAFGRATVEVGASA